MAYDMMSVHQNKAQIYLKSIQKCLMAFIQGTHLEIRTVQSKNLSIDEKRKERRSDAYDCERLGFLFLSTMLKENMLK